MRNSVAAPAGSSNRATRSGAATQPRAKMPRDTAASSAKAVFSNSAPWAFSYCGSSRLRAPGTPAVAPVSSHSSTDMISPYTP